MKHHSTPRRMKLSTVLLCLTILLSPFSTKPLFARNDRQNPKPPLAFSVDAASNHRPQPSAPAVPAQSNSSINIYIFLPVITALPVQTQAESTNTAHSPTTNANAPQSLNIYIFLPAIAE